MDNLISVAQAAIMLGVSEGYVRRLLRMKRVKGEKFSGWTWLVYRQSVEEFKDRREEKKYSNDQETKP